MHITPVVSVSPVKPVRPPLCARRPFCPGAVGRSRKSVMSAASDMCPCNFAPPPHPHPGPPPSTSVKCLPRVCSDSELTRQGGRYRVDRRSKVPQNHRSANTRLHRSMAGTDSRRAVGRRLALLFIQPGCNCQFGRELWAPQCRPNQCAPDENIFKTHPAGNEKRVLIVVTSLAKTAGGGGIDGGGGGDGCGGGGGGGATKRQFSDDTRQKEALIRHRAGRRHCLKQWRAATSASTPIHRPSGLTRTAGDRTLRRRLTATRILPSPLRYANRSAAGCMRERVCACACAYVQLLRPVPALPHGEPAACPRLAMPGSLTLDNLI